MAFDDDKIRIEVDGAQASAQLDALAQEVRDLEKELETLNSTAGVTNVEIEGTTRRLGEARGKFAEASEGAKTFEQSATGADLSVKGMTKSIGAGLSILSILRDNLQALEPVQKALAENFRAGAIEAGVNSETLDNVTRSLDSLVHPSHIAKNAVEALSIAFEKGAKLAKEFGIGNKEAAETAAQAWAESVGSVYAAIQAQEKLNEAVFGSKKEIASFSDAVIQSVGALLQHGNATEEQMARARESIQKAIDDELTAFGRVPPALQELADQLGVVRSLQEDAAKSLAKEEEALEKAAVKSAQERAKAETKAAEEVVAALAKQEASFLKMLEDTNKFVAERDKILNAPNQGFDSSQDAGKAKDDLAGLNRQIKAIQDSPIVTEDQDQQLRDLQRQARAAADELRDLSGVYTLAAMNGEELAQKQNAAWQKYYAIRHANDAIVQRNVDKDLRALGEQTDAVGELGDSAEGTAGAFSDVADAAGSVGDEAKKGTDKAKEGLAALLEGAEEAKPLLVEIRNLLQEIVTLGSQADL